MTAIAVLHVWQTTKPIDALTMTWNGDVIDVHVKAWKGAVGGTLLLDTFALDPNDPPALELRGTIHFTRWAYNLEPDHDAADELLVLAQTDLSDATSRDDGMAYAWNVLSMINATEDDLVSANMAARRAYEADAYLAQAEDILWRLWTTAYDLEISVQTQQW